MKTETEPDYTSPEYRAKVEAAFRAGKRIEANAKENDLADAGWVDFIPPRFYWDDLDYRIHPEDEAATEPDFRLEEYQVKVFRRWLKQRNMEREFQVDGLWIKTKSTDVWRGDFLYRDPADVPKPAPKVKRVPLTAEDCPSPMWLSHPNPERNIGTNVATAIVSMSDSSVLWVLVKNGAVDWRVKTFQQLMDEGYLYSADRKTWLPCCREEAA